MHPLESLHGALSLATRRSGSSGLVSNYYVEFKECQRSRVMVEIAIEKANDFSGFPTNGSKRGLLLEYLNEYKYNY